MLQYNAQCRKCLSYKKPFLKNFLYLCNGLWLLPLSRTYLIGYFLTILQHRNLAVLITRRSATRCPRLVYIPITDWLGVCDISSGVGVCVAYSCEGQPRPRCWISKCSACAFLWTYPEIRTCSTESWWHSSLRGKQRHTTRN